MCWSAPVLLVVGGPKSALVCVCPWLPRVVRCTAHGGSDSTGWWGWGWWVHTLPRSCGSIFPQMREGVRLLWLATWAIPQVNPPFSVLETQSKSASLFVYWCISFSCFDHRQVGALAGHCCRLLPLSCCLSFSPPLLLICTLEKSRSRGSQLDQMWVNQFEGKEETGAACKMRDSILRKLYTGACHHSPKHARALKEALGDAHVQPAPRQHGQQKKAHFGLKVLQVHPFLHGECLGMCVGKVEKKP